jgi:tetratricopeptide (TPR) repeat protein
MARLIPEAFWQRSFLRPDGKYDGQKFEAMAFHLLQHLHGLGWQQTGKSHDGSKDFEKVDKHGSLWAECKAYSDKLSLYVISPTLVMALIESPHTVIIISRSQINANAFRHLAAYQLASGKTIISYDGTVLDHAILIADIYEKYFPGTSLPKYSDPNFEVRCSLTRDVLIAPSEEDFTQNTAFTGSKRPIDVVRYGLLRIDISIKNLSAISAGKIKMELAAGKIDPSLQIISFGGKKNASSTSLQIPRAGIVRTSLIIQPREAKELLRLPEIEITGPGAPARPIKTGQVHVSHLYQIEIVGRTHKKILERSCRFLSNRRQTVVISIEGASGTGKSRLLQEIAKVGFQEGFRCHFYDPEFDNAKGEDQVLRSLVADLSEVPLIKRDKAQKHQTASFSSSSNSLLSRILYDADFPVLDHIEEVVDVVISLLNRKQTLLIVDNVQFTNNRFIHFLERLLAKLNQSHSKRAALILSINNDFVRPDSNMAAFLVNLRAASSDIVKSQNYFHSRLPDFDGEDVAEFVQSVLSGESGQNHSVLLYEKTMKLLVKQVQPRPLNLWQSLMYLADEGIVSLENGRLKFSGDETLLSRLNNIPEKLEDLLALRWSRIRENESRGGIAENDLEMAVRAAYLVGSDTRAILNSLGATEEAINCLLRVGIFVSNTGARIQFFHNQLFIFFRERCKNFAAETATALRRSFETLRLSRNKFQQYFILSHFSGSVNAPLLAATVRYMKQNGLTIDYWKEYTDILLSYLTNPTRPLNTTSLTGVAVIGEWQKQLNSLPLGNKTLREFFTERLLKSSRRSLPGESLAYFYRIVVNSFFSVYNDTEAIEAINLAISDLGKCRFKIDKERKNALASMLNRRTAALKNFGQVEEAFSSGQQALEIFKEIGNQSMLVETMWDIGSLLSGVAQRRAESWEFLEKGVKLFEQNKNDMAEPAPCRYYLVSAELLLRERRYLETYNACAEGIRHTERVRNHFWGIRLLLMEVTARLLAFSDEANELETIDLLLIKARDWINTSQAERSLWTLAYLDAKLFTRKGEYEAAGKAFTESLGKLASRLRSPEQVAWRSRIFCDIAATCRKFTIDLDREILSAVANNVVRNEMMEILNMPDDIFAKYNIARMADARFGGDDEIIELS